MSTAPPFLRRPGLPPDVLTTLKFLLQTGRILTESASWVRRPPLGKTGILIREEGFLFFFGKKNGMKDEKRVRQGRYGSAEMILRVRRVL